MAAAVTLVLGPLLALGASGCEAVLGTGDLQDQVGASEAGPGDDDDDDDDDAAIRLDSGSDASLAVDGTTSGEGGALDAGDAGDAARRGDAAAGGEGGSADAGDAEPPSCATSTNGSANSCGIDGNTDCCGSAPVAAARYYRTFDEAQDIGDPVNVSSFTLDVFEVTVGRMRAYAAWLASAAGGAPDAGGGIHTHLNGGHGLLVEPAGTYESGWLASNNGHVTQGAGANGEFADNSACPVTYTATAGDADNLPMNCVSWYDAYAFCIWDGGFLPTEAEWELAAVNGSSQFEYPWGNSPAPDADHAIFGCTDPETCSPDTVGVAFIGNTVSGQYDMLGNVAEWTLDDYSPTGYDDTEDCQDCVDLPGNGYKVDRGGAFSDSVTSGYLTTQHRGQTMPATRTSVAGFRCARGPS